MQNHVDKEGLAELNKKIKEQEYVDREDLLTFLTLLNTNDSQQIVAAVKEWLSDLSANPNYATVVFPKGDIEAVLGDLDSYGRVQTDTILSFKENSNKTLPIT